MHSIYKLKMMYFLALFITGLVIYPVKYSWALTEESIITGKLSYSSSFTLEPPDIVDYIPDFVNVPKGGIAWDVFAKTQSIEYLEKDEEGRDIQGVIPKFGDEINKLDGQTVLMQGYMFPLEAEEEQSMFLFGPFPVSCPFHYHVGPNLIIEVHAKDKIKYEWDAINITGRLELVARDDEYNVFYRLHDAEAAK